MPQLQSIGHISGEVGAVALHGPYCYAGVGPRLIVLDPTSSLRPVGQSTPLPGLVQRVVAVDSLAFVSVERGGLQILDIADPTCPMVVGGWTGARGLRDLALAGRYAYLASGHEGLAIVDVGDPARPGLIGTQPTPAPAQCIAVAGARLAVGTERGFQLLDRRDPVRLTLLGGQDIGWVTDIALNDRYVYVVAGMLLVFDLSDPARPKSVPLNTYALSHEHAVCGTVVGSLAYIAVQGLPPPPGSSGILGKSGLRVVPAAAPLGERELPAPGPTERLPVSPDPDVVFSAAPLDLTVQGRLACVALGHRGVEMVDLGRRSAMGCYRSLPFGAAYDVAANGTHIYVVNGSYLYPRGLSVVDIADPSHPTVVGFCETPESAHGVALAPPYAYVAAYNRGLRVIDVSDPQRPTEVGCYDDNQPPPPPSAGLATVWNRLRGRWLRRKRPDAAPPRMRLHQALAVGLAGKYAYVASGRMLHVIDTSMPTRPVEVTQYELPEAYDGLNGGWGIMVVDTYAYLAAGQGGLEILDLRDPLQPRWVARAGLPGYANGVAVVDHYAYVAAADGLRGRLDEDSFSGLRVIDVSDPTHPTEVGAYQLPGYAESVTAVGDHLCVAVLDAGIHVVKLT